MDGKRESENSMQSAQLDKNDDNDNDDGMKKEVMHLFFCLSSNLVIILLHENAWPHVARMTLQPILLISHPLTTSFFKHLNTFYAIKVFHSKREVENAFIDFLASKPFEIIVNK